MGYPPDRLPASPQSLPWLVPFPLVLESPRIERSPVLGSEVLERFTHDDRRNQDGGYVMGRDE